MVGICIYSTSGWSDPDSAFSQEGALERVNQRNTYFGNPRSWERRCEKEDAASFAEERGVSVKETFEKSHQSNDTDCALRHASIATSLGLRAKHTKIRLHTCRQLDVEKPQIDTATLLIKAYVQEALK